MFMKKMIRLVTALILSVTLFSTTSCNKDDEVPREPIEIQLLTAKTWQIEEVAMIETGGTPHLWYKRGAANNEEDYSLVRHTFKKDGSMTSIDQEGASSNDGRYQLLENNRLRLTSDGITMIFENVVIRENSFSCRLAQNNGYIQFTFSPVQ